MGKTLKIFLTASAAVVLAASCSTSGCLDNGSSIPLAGFYSSSTKQSISLRTVQIHGVGAPLDTAVMKSGDVASQVYLPMHSTASTTAWCIAYTDEGLDDPAFNDTLTLGYESIPYFASEECGTMYAYRINLVKCTEHLIDSVAVTDSLITNVDVERIRIYFRTSTTSTEETEQ